MVNEFELTETKWSLIQQLEAKTLSPKELAELTNTSIANTSQQLRLLEAQGFLKKIKNKGTQTRQERDARILYSIAKRKVWITKISKEQVVKKELKNHDDFLLNLALCDLKEARHIVKFFLDKETLLKKIKCIYYLQTLNQETHFLIITNELEYFRKDNHSFEITYDNKQITIKFWSHSIDEIKKGLDNKEEYFIDLIKRATPLSCEDEEVKKILKDNKKWINYQK